MRLYPLELYLANLAGKHPHAMGYMTKERAYEALKDYTGQDFGYNVRAWKRHINSHGGPKQYDPSVNIPAGCYPTLQIIESVLCACIAVFYLVQVPFYAIGYFVLKFFKRNSG